MSEYFMSTVLPTSVVPARQNNTAYLVGDLVYHTYSGRFLQCVTAGTSGTTDNFNIGQYSAYPSEVTERGSTVRWRDITGSLGWNTAFRSPSMLFSTSSLRPTAQLFYYGYLAGRHTINVDRQSVISEIPRFYVHYVDVPYTYVNISPPYTTGLGFPVAWEYSYVRSMDVNSGQPSAGATWNMSSYISGHVVFEGFTVNILGDFAFGHQSSWNTILTTLVKLRNCTTTISSGSVYSSDIQTYSTTTPNSVGGRREELHVDGGSIAFGTGSTMYFGIPRVVMRGVTISRSDTLTTFRSGPRFSAAGQFTYLNTRACSYEFLSCNLSGLPQNTAMFDLRDLGYKQVLLKHCQGMTSAMLHAPYDYRLRPYLIEITGGYVDGVLDRLRYMRLSHAYRLMRDTATYRTLGATDQEGYPMSLQVNTSPFLQPISDFEHIHRILASVPSAGYYKVSLHLAVPGGDLPSSKELWADVCFGSTTYDTSLPSSSVTSPVVTDRDTPAFSYTADSWTIPPGFTAVKLEAIGYASTRGLVLVNIFCGKPNYTFYICPEVGIDAIA